MKISFVIPAYNEETVIEQCLLSVQQELARHNYDTEVVVVNNASTDKTKELVMKFPEVRLVDELRKGMVRARKAGFDVTDGELVANIDADTIVPAGWLKVVMEEFEKDENLVALSGPYVHYDMPGYFRIVTKIFYFPGYLIGAFGNRFFGKGGLLQGGNFVIRRDAWVKAGGFDTGIEFWGEDTDVARRLSPLGKVKWKWKLIMYTSGRRLKAEGILKISSTYAINFFSTNIIGRPVTRKYTDIRPK